MIFDNQLRYAIQIIESYQGNPPLHVWLKDYFRQHRQMGSRDRKTLSALVYGFYRLGHAIRDIPAPDRILAGAFLCNTQPGPFLAHHRPAWNDAASLPLEEKIPILQTSIPSFSLESIFPWAHRLSDGIDHQAFCRSFLRQPDLFLRMRPGFRDQVLARIPQPYTFIPPFTLRLPNGARVEEHFTPDQEIVIQDYSSQRIAAFIQPALDSAKASPIHGPAGNQIHSPAGNQNQASAHPIHAQTSRPTPAAGSLPLMVWDACAASGGKSLLTYDLDPDIELTVSDIRDSILHNLGQRFKKAGIRQYHAFTADLTRTISTAALPGPQDLIILDAPCSGSGTWSRTPEELYFFKPEKIDHYSRMQAGILANVLPHLRQRPGAGLVYITCSVFRQENEDIIAACLQTPGEYKDGAGPKSSFKLELRQQAVIPGYTEAADSMFAARFQL